MLNKISNHVYYLDHSPKTDRPVLGLIVGNKASLVVDAGNSSAHARMFLDLTKDMDIAPLTYLAITHWHWDHIFGIEAMDLISLSHEKTKNKLNQMTSLSWDNQSLDKRVAKKEEIKFCSKMIRLEMNETERKNFRTVSTDISFNDEVEIDLGAITCIIKNVAGCHGIDASIIYVPEDKVMFLGDCMSPDFYSGLVSYNLDEYSAMVNKIKKYKTKHYITSHMEAQTHEAYWQKVEHIQSIGQLITKESDFNDAVSAYKAKFNKTPGRSDVYYIRAFLNGCKKTNISAKSL